MKKEASYGVIPMRRQVAGLWEVFLVQHAAGHWGFPKGHPEGLESSQETAWRELEEETHLVVDKLIFEEPLKEQYQFMRDGVTVHKSVDYYLALVIGEPQVQMGELRAGCWVDLHHAAEKMRYPEGKALVQKVIGCVNTLIT